MKIKHHVPPNAKWIRNLFSINNFAHRILSLKFKPLEKELEENYLINEYIIQCNKQFLISSPPLLTLKKINEWDRST